MASNAAKDVEAFLHKVEEIETIVKGLNSGDEGRLKDAMQKADEYIKSQKAKPEGEEEERDLPQTTTGFSKTVINRSNPADDGAGAGNMEYTDQKAFMAALEADAKERSEKRRMREKEAQIIKELGNQAFKEHNFEKALEYYNQAIEKVRDNCVLYTNRAQTHIKLGQYQEALRDCDWALRASPQYIKAYVHMGRAHLALKQYQQARDSYTKVTQIDPKKECLVQEYIGEVDRVEAADSAEQKARELFAAGDAEAQGMAEVMERIQKPDQLPMYYSGGFRVLANLVSKEENQAQFRTQKGIQLLQDHSLVNRCMSASPHSLTKEERDVLTAMFDLMSTACKGNDANQEQLLKQEGSAEQMLQLLMVSPRGKGKALKMAILRLLFTVSQTAHGRTLIVTYFDLHRMLSTLFDLVQANASYTELAAAVLNNLSLEKKFRSFVRDKVEDILPPFEALLKDTHSKSGVVSLCISTVMNLTNDKTVRLNLASRRSLWQAGEELVRASTSSDSDLLEAALGLLVNITTEPTDTLREFGQRVCAHCRSILPTESNDDAVTHRALTVMGNILPHSIPAVEWICDHGGTALLLEYVKCDKHTPVKHSLKGLTALTQINDSARRTVVEKDGVTTLTQLLSSADEGIVGNAALCLSHCTQVAGVCSSLAQTDIIKELLVLARDGKKPAVQQNCAILIAKLASGDARNLERLRELHGIEILHSCMKHVR
ncbi:hypothetical protein BaRGS_00026301 [Batillaria attramentaria]|uniref:Protein unc-45 homolog B n=1 Tax=Batillaria attramentaria TaxID=370345 RepID=A0ABD0K5F6_9CAEN